jgi:hypothetical protein
VVSTPPKCPICADKGQDIEMQPQGIDSVAPGWHCSGCGRTFNAVGESEGKL